MLVSDTCLGTNPVRRDSCYGPLQLLRNLESTSNTCALAWEARPAGRLRPESEAGRAAPPGKRGRLGGFARKATPAMFFFCAANSGRDSVLTV